MLSFIPALAIQSPLSSFNDYIFTEPVNTNFIQGSILGPNPPSYGPVRGEDSIYLYEAYSEMDALLSAGPSTVRTRAPGIDTAYMRITYTPLTGRPAYQDIYYLFYYNTNGARNVITKKNVTVSMPTNVIPLPSSSSIPSYMAGNAAVYSGAAMTASESLKPLGTSPRVRYLAVTNVAAYYAELKKVAGIAKDFTPTEGTNTHTFAARDKYDTATFVDGSFVYDTIEQNIDYSKYGGGLHESSSQSAGRRRVYQYPSYYISQPIYSSRFSSYVFDDELTIPLYSTGIVRSSQITFKQGWTLSLGYYSRNDSRYVSPTNYVTVAVVSTNFVAITPVSTVEISERDGLVVARVTPNYVAAYNAFFNGTSYPYPDDISYPQAPSGPQAFGPEETGTRYNNDSRSITISPYSVGLVLDIDWHTGFNNY